MLSELPVNEHPGALIVTRLKTDADQIAEQINRLSKKSVAVAHHTDSNTKLTELGEWPVLVITHRAYELALDFLGQDGTIQQTWPFFHQWGSPVQEFCDRKRKLVIIDECLDIVEQLEAGLDGLRNTLGAIPQSIREKFPREVAAIEALVKSVEQIGSEGEGQPTAEAMLLINAIHEDCPPDFNGLRKALRERVRFDYQIGKNDLRENERLKKQHDQRLKSLQSIFSSWAYYAKVNAHHTLNTARLLVPEGVKGAVVLDATASANVIYDLFDGAAVLTPPEESRSYRNVTLHVSRGHKTGKNFMENHAKEVCQKLFADLNERLSGRRVFIVCHKGVESVLETYDPAFTMKLGHWGKVDGSNEWKDCDTCVVFGLSYRPDTWTANVFMAFQGPQETEWLRADGNRPFKQHLDIRQALKEGQMVTEVVQAINRVRCRRVIDHLGNCPPTEVYLMLPGGRLADVIVDGIRSQMPGIQVLEDWEFRGQRSRVKKAKGFEAILKYLENMPPGRQSKTHLCDKLGVSTSTIKRFIAAATGSDSPLARAVEKAGVVIDSLREGKTQRLYFIKG